MGYAGLPGDNPRRQEEQEFLGLGCRVGAPEEMPDERQASDQGYLVDVHALRRNDDSADDHGAAVGNSDLGFGGLRVQRGDTLNARNTRINLRVFDQHVHEDRAFGRDLRGYFQLQNGVNKLDGNGVIDRRLNRDFRTLLHGRFFIVLGDDLGLREQLADALGFRRGDEQIHG